MLKRLFTAAVIALVVILALPTSSCAQRRNADRPRDGAGAGNAEAIEGTLRVGGDTREYLVHVPPRVSNPAPVVFVFHGGGGNPKVIMLTSGMNATADKYGFIAVYPAGEGRGIQRGGGWDTGGSNSRQTADDIAFTRALVNDIAQRYPIDRRRIYATGMSLGGMFSYHLACKMSDTFAAIAPVASTMDISNCSPRNPVPVLHIHGTADENVPWNGGQGKLTGKGNNWPPVPRGISYWTQENRCTANQRSIFKGPDTECFEYQGCAESVSYCLVQNGGHAWPGGRTENWMRKAGVYVSPNFIASDVIWQFFQQHPKRG